MLRKGGKVGKGVEGDSGKEAIERRRRYEGEEAWENRGMAQVPFYNPGNVWRRSQESLIHKSLRSQCAKLDQSPIFLLIKLGFVQDLVVSPRCVDNKRIDSLCLLLSK
jgi:hypothetical protein